MKKLPQLGWILFVLLFTASFLQSKTIRVPEDYLTIKAAVSSSRNGDDIVVEDGSYFEKNIIIDKDIRIKAKSLFGAAIYGSMVEGESIFIVRAGAEIAGFILLNSSRGILQRNSADVAWQAHDLIIMNMSDAGISVNAERGNYGNAKLNNILIYSCDSGIKSNDAREIRVSGAAVIGCREGLGGSNHMSFTVEKSILIDCRLDIYEDEALLPANATNKIVFGRDIYLSKLPKKLIKNSDIRQIIERIWGPDFERSVYGNKNMEKRACLFDKVAGDWNYSQKKYIEAARLWSNALKNGQKARLFELTWRIARDLVHVSDLLRQPAESLKFAKIAVDEIAAHSRELPFAYFQETFIEDKAGVFENVIDRLYEMDRRDPGRGFDREAFVYAEKYKTLGGRMIPLRDRRAVSKEKMIPDSQVRGETALREISRLQKLLGNEGLSKEKKRGALENLENAEDEYKAYLFQRKTSDSDPLSKSDFNGEEALRRYLGRDGAIIEYFIGEKNIIIFLITPKAHKIVKIPAADKIKSMVPNYLEFLKVNGEGEFKGGNGGRALYELLLGNLNLSADEEITKLTIIPDGILHYLPFESLALPVLPNEDAVRDRFLIERYEISYSPSLGDLLLRVNDYRKKEYKYDLLAVANPGPKQPVYYYGILPQLKYAMAEVRGISRFFRDRKTELVSRELANEEYLKKLNLAEYRIIHIAAHGIFNNFQWWRSALFLDPGNDGMEDGWLQPLDILGMNISAELVVLSACRSGQSPLKLGHGIVGLHQAFFLAGAGSVLSSLWEINDRTTITFMEKFYSELKREKSGAGALREAKLLMIRSKNSHPRYWAAFVISGDCSHPLYSARAAR